MVFSPGARSTSRGKAPAILLPLMLMLPKLALLVTISAWLGSGVGVGVGGGTGRFRENTPARRSVTSDSPPRSPKVRPRRLPCCMRLDAVVVALRAVEPVLGGRG